jgi:hypothetical protein
MLLIRKHKPRPTRPSRESLPSSPIGGGNPRTRGYHADPPRARAGISLPLRLPWYNKRRLVLDVGELVLVLTAHLNDGDT